MTDLHIPTHIDMTRRIAVQETATVTDLTVTEQRLRVQYDEHQREAAAERDRIEAELRAVREQADKRLAALADDERRLAGELTDVGRRLQQHRYEAEQAQQSIADWCTRQGVNPADLPPLRDTGPMPVVSAQVAEVGKLGDLRKQDNGLPMVWSDACAPGGYVCAVYETAGGPGIDMPDGTRICGRPVESEPCSEHSRPVPRPVETSQPLPAIDGADALLEQGRRMADPSATRTDLPGGDQPEQGGFQGDTDA